MAIQYSLFIGFDLLAASVTPAAKPAAAPLTSNKKRPASSSSSVSSDDNQKTKPTVTPAKKASKSSSSDSDDDQSPPSKKPSQTVAGKGLFSMNPLSKSIHSVSSQVRILPRKNRLSSRHHLLAKPIRKNRQAAIPKSKNRMVLL
jgi:hypothetical protein